MELVLQKYLYSRPQYNVNVKGKYIDGKWKCLKAKQKVLFPVICPNKLGFYFFGQRGFCRQNRWKWPVIAIVKNIRNW